MLESAVMCDFVFLDPPYRKMGDYNQVLGLLSRLRLLNPGATVIAELQAARTGLAAEAVGRKSRPEAVFHIADLRHSCLFSTATLGKPA